MAALEAYDETSLSVFGVKLHPRSPASADRDAITETANEDNPK